MIRRFALRRAGKAPCASLKLHLKRLKRSATGIGRAATKARFVHGSVLGYEALRVGDKKLAGRAVEALKPVARLGSKDSLADDAMVLIARLRLLRGARARAAKSLRHILCEMSGGDMRARAKKIAAQAKLKLKPCSARKKFKPKAVKTTKKLKERPAQPVNLGPVTASGGKMTTSLRRADCFDPGHGGDDPGARSRGRT